MLCDFLNGLFTAILRFMGQHSVFDPILNEAASFLWGTIYEGLLDCPT